MICKQCGLENIDSFDNPPDMRCVYCGFDNSTSGQIDQRIAELETQKESCAPQHSKTWNSVVISFKNENKDKVELMVKVIELILSGFGFDKDETPLIDAEQRGQQTQSKSAPYSGFHLCESCMKPVPNSIGGNRCPTCQRIATLEAGLRAKDVELAEALALVADGDGKINTLLANNMRLCTELAWYADPDNWRDHSDAWFAGDAEDEDGCVCHTFYKPILRDGGERARRVLEVKP